MYTNICTSIYMLALYAHSFHITSQLTNPCSELDSGLFAPPSGPLQVLQYFPFCKICSMGTLSCSWLVGAFESESTPFCRETLPSLSSIANANITCTLTPHRTCFPRLLARSKDGEAMGRRVMFLLASSSRELLVLGQKPVPGCGSHLGADLLPGLALF